MAVLYSTPAQFSFFSLLPLPPNQSISHAPSHTPTQMADPTLQREQQQQQNAGGKSWRSSVGSTVLSIGKKAAIAGAAVTAVPVVGPPVLLLSAVGLAFAFPFGVFLTGVACTDKVMGSLLSRPAAGAPQAPAAAREDVDRDGDGEFAEADGGDASNLSSCYESAAEDLFSDAEGKGAKATVLYGEEKIWEQISAVRTIVGYRAALRSSYIEELRALYVFTGVEPPLSFKDSSDLEEINEKLQCLKSVVGIK